MNRVGKNVRGTRMAAAAVAMVLASPLARADGDGLVKVGLSLHSAGTYYVPAVIEGLPPSELLLDTGSSFLVINETMLAALKKAGTVAYSRDLEGRMADGGVRVIPLYRLASIRLGEGCWVHGVEAAVFPGDARPIVGMNVLSRVAPFTVTTEPAGVQFAHCSTAAPPRVLEASAEPGETKAEGARE
jgi:predicted aspartyl protease